MGMAGGVGRHGVLRTGGGGGNEVIEDCSIELNIGRRYGLIGQNGCGKTSFLQVS
jgi:ATPase subunit of ABC transporter with duplicated ATPase domains